MNEQHTKALEELVAILDGEVPGPGANPINAFGLTIYAPAKLFNAAMAAARAALREPVAEAPAVPIPTEAIEAEFSRLGGVGDSYLEWMEEGVWFAEAFHNIRQPSEPK